MQKEVEEVGNVSAPEEDRAGASALRRARLIRTLAEELEVNLPGIEVILRLLDECSR